MKTCPKCKAGCQDTDNFCGKCTYHFPTDQETVTKAELENEYKAVTLGRLSKIDMKKRIAQSVVLFAVLAFALIVFAVYEVWVAFLITSLFFILEAILFAFQIKRFKVDGKLHPYIPLKGFRFFRKSSEEKLRVLKSREKISSLFALASILYLIIPIIPKNAYCYITVIFILLILLVYSHSCSSKKKRIKFHEPVDDANYFELEELGLITEKDVIISLYKDFASWKDLKKASKLLVLTQDALVCLNFEDRTHAHKLVFLLRDITGLGFDSEITAVFTAFEVSGQNIRIYLKGESIQDSPEEFISRFLKQLDNYYLNRPHGEPKTYDRSQYTPSAESRNLREIDITDFPVATSSADTAVSNDTINTSSRTIDL